jgi:hypothetical protein
MGLLANQEWRWPVSGVCFGKPPDPTVLHKVQPIQS